MLDILDIINEATKEANSFENHAAKDLTLEERLLYLQGLALVMNADGEIHPEEKEYIRILIKSFEMDESILESFVEFAQRPDKDTVQAFFRAFKRRPIAQLFLFDALMMTRRDDSVDEREKAVVDKIAEQLEVLKGTYQDIYDLFCHIKNKDWEESALYFSSHLLNPEHFNHLLAYYEVDLNELQKFNELNHISRLSEVLLRELKKNSSNSPNHKWGKLENATHGFSKITSQPIFNYPLPKSIFITWVQSKLDKNLMSVRHGNLYLDEDCNFDIESLGLSYNEIGKSISFKPEVNENEYITDQNIINRYFSENKIDIDLEFFVDIHGAKGIALCDGRNLPMYKNKQVSAVTHSHKMGDDGHPNAISSIDNSKTTVRWCVHCKGGHGSSSYICDDNDKRFTDFETKDFITNYGLYLVK